jgi:nicotinamidase-related amidase
MSAAKYSTRKKRNVSKRKVKRGKKGTKASKKVKGSKRMRNKHRKSYKQRGGLNQFSETRTSDTKALFNHYLQKKVLADDKYKKVITQNDYKSIVFGEKDLLMVIDMQNDFVDRVVPGLTGPPIPDGNIGAFAVNNGGSIIEPIKELYNKVLMNRGKVVFSRDVHPCDHCSFAKKPEDCESEIEPEGLFPPHCISKSVGSGFVNEIYEDLSNKTISPTIEAGDISVIFKGCDQATDSFGALPYVASDYATERQNPGCKSANMANTGGFYAKTTGTDGKEVLKNEFDAANEINKGDAFTVPGGIDNIYVVGLAGDYCVCDTAINLKKKYPAKEVIIIHDLTRNAFIPFGDSAGFFLDNVKEGVDGTYSEKPLITYAFDFDGSGSRSLTKDERTDLTPNTLSAKFHFLQDPTEIFDRYAVAGVKVMVSTDLVEPI